MSRGTQYTIDDAPARIRSLRGTQHGLTHRATVQVVLELISPWHPEGACIIEHQVFKLADEQVPGREDDIAGWCKNQRLRHTPENQWVKRDKLDTVMARRYIRTMAEGRHHAVIEFD
jgi:hypothetical protein